MSVGARHSNASWAKALQLGLYGDPKAVCCCSPQVDCCGTCRGRPLCGRLGTLPNPGDTLVGRKTVWRGGSDLPERGMGSVSSFVNNFLGVGGPCMFQTGSRGPPHRMSSFEENPSVERWGYTKHFSIVFLSSLSSCRWFSFRLARKCRHTPL